MNKTPNILLLGLFILTACSSTGQPVAAVTLTAPPLPAVTEVKVLPTAISPSQAVIYEEFQVVMSQAEITTSYLTEFDSTREPPAGKKFLWIHIVIKNIGQQEQDLPAPEHFSVLNGTAEYKSIYGHRKDHADYMSLTMSMVQGQEVDAWLRFDIPAEADLRELSFVFLPTSAQVGVSPSSPDYPYAVNKPTYVWSCEP